MLRIAAAILIFLLFNAKSAMAVYDPLSVANNKFGIHVLDPNEIGKAAELVNSSGGQWGYITVPIRANDRDLVKWTKFMEDCARLKMIPILRIASFPVGDRWMAPNEYDLVDFANFLNELPWPIKNRYVIVYNEPNHEGEWGGFIYPEEYARVLDRAIDIFHKRHEDFFIISAGLDASQNPNSYYQKMLAAWPDVFAKVDGFSFHAYGNPAFNTYPNIYSRVNVASYRFEYPYSIKKPIFITEAGWKNGGWLKKSFEEIWTEPNIVAITPFLLDAQTEPFKDFSFLDGSNFRPFAKEFMAMPKIIGQPRLAETKPPEPDKMNPSWTGNLPRILKNDWIGSYVQTFLRMFNLLK